MTIRKGSWVRLPDGRDGDVEVINGERAIISVANEDDIVAIPVEQLREVWDETGEHLTSS